MLDKLQVAVRPRSLWEAIELGFPMVKCWGKSIYTTWLVITLPFFAVLYFVLGPGTAIFLFWWFKPLFDRWCLFIISRATFGHVPTLSESLAFSKKIFSTQVIESLLWLRIFDFSRSFSLPLRQLEGLRGAARRKRLSQLRQRGYSSTAGWMGCAYVHLEAVLYLVPLIFVYTNFEVDIMTTQSTLIDWFNDFWLLFFVEDAVYGWLTAGCYYVAVSIIEPLFVASGFSLYLNRRSQLEAWHIEVAFRKLAGRLQKESQEPKKVLA